MSFVSKGFIYVLVSPKCAFVKIGGTEIPPVVRIREINSSSNYSDTGPWELSDCRYVHDWREVERLMHCRFSDQRHLAENSGARELFRISPAEARSELRQLGPELLVGQDAVEQMFVYPDFALYLEKLFAFSG